MLEIPAFGPPADNTFWSDSLSDPPLPTRDIQAQQYANQSRTVEYETYISLIDDELSDENEDPQLLKAIEASLTDLEEQTNNTSINEAAMKSLLTSFQANNIDLSESETNANINISRKAVFSSTQQAIERKKLSFCKPVFVTFAGEEAVDDGGPKREFFMLLMRNISESLIFHGSWFSHDLGLLESNRYQLAGKLVA